MNAIGKPTTRSELMRLVREAMQAYGDDCDLNGIDVSGMADLSRVFQTLPFTGDISRWDVSNATNMDCLFQGSKFNGDISRWNTGCVRNMNEMFMNSPFNGDISQWDVSNVLIMSEMFSQSTFSGDVRGWNVTNVNNFQYMFLNSNFRGDLSAWKVHPNALLTDALPIKHMAKMPTSVFHWEHALYEPGKLAPAQQRHWSELSPIGQGLGLQGNALVHWLHEQWCNTPAASIAYALPDLE